MPKIRRERDTLVIWPFAPFLHPHDPPTVDICESPTVCVQVNQQWAAFVIGALETLVQPDLWNGTEEEVYATIQKVERIINMFSSPCGDDTGESEYKTLIRELTVYQTILEGMYDGTPESVDEDAPNTNFDSDSADSGDDAEYRAAALCAAVHDLVDTFCAELLAQAEEYQAALNILSTLLAAAAGGGLIGLVIVVAVNVLVEISLDALQSEIARENVACCILGNLQGVTISQENFCASIVGCYEEGSSHERDIMNGFRASDFCRRGNYVAFLKLIAEHYRYAKAGITLPCTCGCEVVITFDLEDDSYEVIEGGRALLSGENYVINGESYVSGEQFGDIARVTIPYDLDCPVDGVSMLFRFDHGSANNNIGLRCTLKLGGITQDEINITEEWTKNAWNTKVFEVFAESVDEIELQVAFQNTIEDDGKFVQMDTVTVN